MKKFTRFLVFLLLAGVLCGCSKEEAEREVVIRSYEEDAYKDQDFTLENDDLFFKMDPATTQFTITDKSSGKVWYSNPEGAALDPIADGVSKKALQSTLILEYRNQNDLRTTLNNFDCGITQGVYDFEFTEDSIKVNYTIGKIAKTYYIPPAAPDERFRQFYDQMSSSEKKKLDDGYRCYDINKLLDTDDKAQLLTDYPDLETTKVWVLRGSTKDHQKEKFEQYFAAVGYTEEDYKADIQLYEVSNTSDKPIFNISVIYRLEGDRFIVEIPNELVSYRNNYPITNLSVLPFLGSGTTTDTGYLLVPDGSGSIINFNNGKTNLNSYYAQLYGWDYGLKRDVVVNETRANFPVFGVANGEQSFISVVDNFSSLATIKADSAGKKHSYNYAYACYDMVHTSQMDISAKSQSTILAFEKNLPEGSIQQSYYFLDTNSYVDMAKKYRDCLTVKFPELTTVAESDMPVNVELIASFDRVKQVAGFPVTRPDTMTSFSQAQAILEDLVNKGFSGLSVRLSGWMNGGINHSIPKNINLTSGLGGKSKFKSLLTYANANNIDFYLSGRVENAYLSDIFDGFLRSRDTAKYISRELSDIPEYSHIFFSDMFETRIKHHYLLRPSVCVDLMENMANYSKKNKVGVGFEDIGTMLSGDYNQKRETTREQSMDMQTEQLAAIKQSGTPILLTGGNDYVLPYADLITNFDLKGKESLIFDEKVPFYEIAVHGLVNYTGMAANLSGDAWDLVLQSAACGAGLSFAFFAEDAEILQNTEYMDFFGASYNGWKDIANEYYSRYKQEMAGLNNQQIVDHKILAEKVTATVYENGTVVYVNRSIVDYNDGTVSIPAKEYKVERSGN